MSEPGRLALFDLDDTLVDRAGAFRAWAARFAERLRLRLEEPDVTWLVRADRDGSASRVVFFEEVRRRFDLAEPAVELLAAYRRELLTHFRPDEHVAAALGELREAGWKIGVVTNGSTTSQLGKLERTGLLPLLDGCCVSEELGARKPDRSIFEAAATRCGSPLDGWMVGDAVVPDVLGGRQAGLSTIWMARGRVWPEASFAPTHVAETLGEAVALILGW